MVGIVVGKTRINYEESSRSDCGLRHGEILDVDTRIHGLARQSSGRPRIANAKIIILPM